MPSKVFESAISSDGPLCSAMRSVRSLPSLIEFAVFVIFSTGAKACLEIIQPPIMLIISITGSSMAVIIMTVCAAP